MSSKKTTQSTETTHEAFIHYNETEIKAAAAYLFDTQAALWQAELDGESDVRDVDVDYIEDNLMSHVIRLGVICKRESAEQIFDNGSFFVHAEPTFSGISVSVFVSPGLDRDTNMRTLYL